MSASFMPGGSDLHGSSLALELAYKPPDSLKTTFDAWKETTLGADLPGGAAKSESINHWTSERFTRRSSTLGTAIT